MAYKNFIPQVWATEIMHNNEKLLVLANLCTTKYKGSLHYGDRITLPGIGAVSVFDYDGTLRDAETVADTSVYLDIDKAKAFNVVIDDIDKKQAIPGAMGAIMQEASEAMADQEDTDIGSVLFDAVKNKLSAHTIASCTPKVARETLFAAQTTLRNAGVKKSTTVCVVVTPEYFEKLALRNEELNTDNTSDMKNGYDAKVAGMEIYVSNNLPKDGGKDVIFVFTKNRAIAHVAQIDKVEAYRPEKSFSDAVKGLNVYGTKVVRPKEVVGYKVTAYANE